MINRLLVLTALLLVSCDKTEPAKPSAAPAPKQEKKKDTPADLKQLAGELPKMDPEKAKFVAVPATPPDPKPAEEAKKPEKPAEEVKKPAAPSPEPTKKAEKPKTN